MLRFNDVASAVAAPGGFLPPPKVKAFGESVLSQCDVNDGVADGIVGDYLGCLTAIALKPILRGGNVGDDPVFPNTLDAQGCLDNG
jgi:hypothetical protein